MRGKERLESGPGLNRPPHSGVWPGSSVTVEDGDSGEAGFVLTTAHHNKLANLAYYLAYTRLPGIILEFGN
ncbi:hypothetical protein L1987_64466 [Smallanthus sonchifolius]|uniref:Uncharacterized protein n=1 Tax=Smallanthus sonchifolius TaxID=185202 RepID=A0ACB9CG17_9ASTR|nr:hypothetical protein L1987_64466 [Smallanthus sonchifolius]